MHDVTFIMKELSSFSMRELFDILPSYKTSPFKSILEDLDNGMVLVIEYAEVWKAGIIKEKWKDRRVKIAYDNTDGYYTNRNHSLGYYCELIDLWEHTPSNYIDKATIMCDDEFERYLTALELGE